MFCKKCGSEISSGDLCENCEKSNSTEEHENQLDQNSEQRSEEKTESSGGWIYGAVLSFVVTCVFLFKGCDKMINYESGEYTSEMVNAYVGGDAYNYIINGTYATSFFVLATLFAIMGIGFICIFYLSKIRAFNRL